MRPVSAKFLQTLRGSHTMCARARICTTYQEGTDPDGIEIPILDGDVQLDGTADVRSTLDMATDGVGTWPTRADSPLAPYGNEVFIERGLAYGNGTREWVSQGYFRLYAPEQDNAPDGPIRITGRDRMSGLVDAKLLAPVQFGAAAAFGDVLAQLVEQVYPDVTIEWDDDTVSAPIGRPLLAEQSRYEFLRDLVQSVGKVFYFDHRGVLVVKAPPDLGVPVWDVDHGAGGVLVNLSRQLSREGVYNAVIATGEAADTVTPVRAVAVDANPTSPTYFYGRFGQVPRDYSSPFITTEAQARSAAESILRQSLGLPYSVDFTAVPNPALEPLDPIQVRYRGGAPEVHVIERLTIPLTAAAGLTASTREQTAVILGSA